MVTSVRHTGIVVSDMREARRFYVELLECGRIVFDEVVGNQYIDDVTGLKEAKIHLIMLEMPNGTRVELLQYLSHPLKPPARQESCAVGCSHVALQVSDVDALHKRLVAAGYEFHAPPQLDPKGYAKVTYCRGPDNVILELVQVMNSANTPYSK